MMHDLLLDALLLMLLWLSTMRRWVWLRRQGPPAKLPPSPPNAPRGLCKTRRRVRASPPSPAVPPVSTPRRRLRRPLPAHRHGGAPRVGGGIRWPPHSTIVPHRSATIRAGPAGAICGPTAIPVAAPGGRGTASLAVVTAANPRGRSCLASVGRLSRWDGRWLLWRKAWASARSPGCVRSIRIRCGRGWSRPRTRRRLSRRPASTPCAAVRSNWTPSVPWSVRSRRARAAQGTPVSGSPGRLTGCGGLSPRSARDCWRAMSESAPEPWRHRWATGVGRGGLQAVCRCF